MKTLGNHFKVVTNDFPPIPYKFEVAAWAGYVVALLAVSVVVTWAARLTGWDLAYRWPAVLIVGGGVAFAVRTQLRRVLRNTRHRL